MTRININTAPSYDIVITDNFDKLLSEIDSCNLGKKMLIVTDSTVAKLYLDSVCSLLKDYQIFTVVLPAGEKHKDINSYLAIIDAMAKAQLTRQDTAIALGGGVVGDIVGFAASTYLRGINFVQIPTTLLANIDSSIGGKTAINLASGKNLLGAFYQPRLVYINLQVLQTLDNNQWINGIGEGIKYAIISGGEIFDILQSGVSEHNLKRFVELCINVKKDIVEKDTKEMGERRLLNLGHTFGHAIEKLSEYTIPHGVAVVKGIIIALKASQNYDSVDKVMDLCKQYNIDISVDYTIEQMIEIIKTDKKMAQNDNINFVFVQSIGNVFVRQVSLEQLKMLSQ